MTNGTIAKNYLDKAKEYLSALEVLVEQPARSGVLPIGLLASQAIELSLKAFLLSIGWDETDIKSELGHDLVKAWDTSKAEGLKIGWESNFSVAILSLSHNAPYLFRYPKDRVAAGIPELGVLQKDVSNIICVVDSALNN